MEEEWDGQEGESGTLQEGSRLLYNVIDFKPLGGELAERRYSAAWPRCHMGCLCYNSINRRED